MQCYVLACFRAQHRNPVLVIGIVRVFNNHMKKLTLKVCLEVWLCSEVLYVAYRELPHNPLKLLSSIYEDEICSHLLDKQPSDIPIWHANSIIRGLNDHNQTRIVISFFPKQGIRWVLLGRCFNVLYEVGCEACFIHTRKLEAISNFRCAK
jgi:hypothetical protein